MRWAANSLLRRPLRRRPNVIPATDDIASNLSFVLHVRSSSATARSMATACQSHAAWIDSLAGDQSLPVATTVGGVDASVDLWLTARIGLYPWLADVIESTVGYAPTMVCIDAQSPKLTTASLFRADANLTLSIPDGATVGVASLVARPTRRDAHLILAGPYSWPDDQAAALRQLERLIQRDVDQWVPLRALWPAPAEVLLAGEIV